MRRRWIYKDGEAFEVPLDYVLEPRNLDSGALWGDRQYDGMDPRFSTRTQHREFMKAHGLTTQDDYKQRWQLDAERRAAALLGYDPLRKGDIAEAIRKLESGYKPRVERED